jgi:hypothetical protein
MADACPRPGILLSVRFGSASCISRISILHQEEPTIRTANTAAAALMASRVILITWISLITSIILISGRPASCADLVGRVLNNRGEPVSGVIITVANSAGVDAGKAVSDANGGYAISNLAPGAYKFNVVPGQWVMSYIGNRGLTVNWGFAPHAPPVAVARQGTAADSPVTTSAAPSKISHVQSKPESGRSDAGSGDNN